MKRFYSGNNGGYGGAPYRRPYQGGNQFNNYNEKPQFEKDPVQDQQVERLRCQLGMIIYEMINNEVCMINSICTAKKEVKAELFKQFNETYNKLKDLRPQAIPYLNKPSYIYLEINQVQLDTILTHSVLENSMVVKPKSGVKDHVDLVNYVKAVVEKSVDDQRKALLQKDMVDLQRQLQSTIQKLQQQKQGQESDTSQDEENSYERHNEKIESLILRAAEKDDKKKMRDLKAQAKEEEKAKKEEAKKETPKKRKSKKDKIESEEAESN